MIEKSENKVKWLEFELFANFPRLIHRVFLRHGGVSQGSLASLNIGIKHDLSENVEENRRRIARQCRLEQMIFPIQIHSDLVKEIHQVPIERPQCDGLITNLPRMGLSIAHADCQAAIFYDPVHHVLANVHCGWRGNVADIYKKTIERMQINYHTDPKDLHVCISPSLCPERAEFINYRTEFPESFWQFQYKPNYFDLWALSEWQLLEAGMLPNHIQIARISTWANPKDYYSYRRDKNTGSHATVAALL